MAKKRRVRNTSRDKKDQTGEAKKVLKTRLNPEEQFRQEYAYVLRDLRQVLILAVVMFALLILLNVLLS